MLESVSVNFMDLKLAYCCGPDRLACLTTVLWLPSSYPPEGNQCFYPDCALVLCGVFPAVALEEFKHS